MSTTFLRKNEFRSKSPVVWLISGPTLRKEGGPDYDYLSTFGQLEYIITAGEYLIYDMERMVEKISERLDDFDAETDYIVWVGGDPASSLAIGGILASKGIRTVNWLRFDRRTKPDGSRSPWTGNYVPIKLHLGKVTEMTMLNTEDFEVIDLTVKEARELIETILGSADNDDGKVDDLTNELDKAQGDVHIKQAEERFVIIRVSP